MNSSGMNDLPSKFQGLIKFKFLFTIIKVILLLCIWFTYDENVFKGLRFNAVRGDSDYNNARTT